MNRCEKSAFRLKSVLWVLPVTAVLVMGMLPSGVAYAQDCVVTNGTVTGTNGPDQINCAGVSGPLTIDGRGGNDQIIGTSSADTINGGDGNDQLNGGAGNDTCTADTGDQFYSY